MLIKPHSAGEDPPNDPLSLWMALLHDSQRPCALIDGDGVIRQCNAAYSARIQRPSPEAVIGCRLDQLSPAKPAVDRIDAIRAAIADGNPIVFIGTVRGIEITSVIRPVLPATAHNPGLALVICHVPTDHQWLAEINSSYQIVRADEQICDDLVPPDPARGISHDRTRCQ